MAAPLEDEMIDMPRDIIKEEDWRRKLGKEKRWGKSEKEDRRRKIAGKRE